MNRVLMLLQGIALALALPVTRTDGQAPPAPSSAKPATDPTIQRLETLLKLRESQVQDAEEWVRIEQVLFDQIQREPSVSSARRIQIQQEALNEVKATLVYREAVRDAVKLELNLARDRAAKGSPEEDVDQARARLDSMVKIAEARVAAMEAQRASAAFLAVAEKASLDNLYKMAETSTVISPRQLRQAELRFGLAQAAQNASTARVELARQALDGARRARQEFESGASGDLPGVPASVLRRIEHLEDEVVRLEDEAEFLRRRVQRLLDAGAINL